MYASHEEMASINLCLNRRSSIMFYVFEMCGVVSGFPALTGTLVNFQ